MVTSLFVVVGEARRKEKFDERRLPPVVTGQREKRPAETALAGNVARGEKKAKMARTFAKVDLGEKI
jgi:hypothetical protein